MTIASYCKTTAWLTVLLSLSVFVYSCGDTTAPQPSKGTERLSWTWQNPLPHCRYISDGYAFDGANAIVVGAGPTVAKTTDGGVTWVLNETQQIEAYGDIGAVAFRNPLEGVAIACAIIGGTPPYFIDAFSLLRTTDAGVTWTRINLSIPTYEYLGDVEFLDSERGMVVGEDASEGKFRPIVYRTDNGGVSWSRNVIGESGGGFVDVDFVDPNSGMAVSHQGFIWETRDGGVTWELRFASGAELRAISLADSQTALAVGRQYGDRGVVLRTEDGGASWVALPPDTLPDLSPHLADVFMIDRNTAVAVEPFGGAVLRTTDGGPTWTEQPFEKPGDPGDCGVSRLSFADKSVGWAVGGCGTILKTTDRGITWSGQTKGIRTNLTAVDFATSEIGVAVGRGGVVAQTSDGGETWNLRSSGTMQDLQDVTLIGEDVGTAVGADGTILRTTNGGLTWTPQESNTQQILFGVSFCDADTGAVVGNGPTVLWTENGGATWTPRFVPEVPRVTANLRDISLVGSQVGTAVGESGVILRTTDGGVTWVQQDGEIDGDIITVRFADAKRGIAGTSYGELLHTNNGGATWDCYTVPYGVRPYGYMVDVAYYDGVNAVVLALSNRLYRSTDGGFTWGWESYSILEGVYGADFLAPNVGTVVGEYGMILRTR